MYRAARAPRAPRAPRAGPGPGRGGRAPRAPRHLEGPGPVPGHRRGEVGRLRGTCFSSSFFLRAPFFGGIFDGFRIWYVFFACIVQLILLLQKQKKEGEKLKKKEEEKNQPPQPHKPQDKDSSALSALAPLQLSEVAAGSRSRSLKVTGFNLTSKDIKVSMKTRMSGLRGQKQLAI